jgi:dolichol-phosphate mannosyltransferase
MLRLAADGITSFSTAPLRWITRLGILAVGLALLGIVYAVGRKLFVPESTVEGWTMLLVAVLFMGGIQMLSLGVIGSYVGRIYSEVQQRPLYLLREEEPTTRDEPNFVADGAAPSVPDHGRAPGARDRVRGRT